MGIVDQYVWIVCCSGGLELSINLHVCLRIWELWMEVCETACSH